MKNKLIETDEEILAFSRFHLYELRCEFDTKKGSEDFFDTTEFVFCDIDPLAYKSIDEKRMPIRQRYKLYIPFFDIIEAPENFREILFLNDIHGDDYFLDNIEILSIDNTENIDLNWKYSYPWVSPGFYLKNNDQFKEPYFLEQTIEEIVYNLKIVKPYMEMKKNLEKEINEKQLKLELK